jgi:hypothetical protein
MTGRDGAIDLAAKTNALSSSEALAADHWDWRSALIP